MASLLQVHLFPLFLLSVIIFISPADAFGAGYVSRGSAAQGTQFRHGDILNAVYFLSHAHSILVKEIYFGNWLRDFSQLLDRKTLEVVPEPVLRAVVAVFGYMQHGYTTKEFEVTSERLGTYRPEEHIDNPKGYEGGLHLKLRAVVNPSELHVEPQSAMKSYVADQRLAEFNDTSLDYIEKQLVAAIACGRARDSEAYLHLGAALHTLEDFMAHSNWIELCMQMIGNGLAHHKLEAAGMSNVFAFVGSAAKVETKRGPAPPLVTGTFGALDLYQTLLGEMGDKISAMTLPGLQTRTQGGDGSVQGIAKILVAQLNKLDEKSFDGDIVKITKSATEHPADWGKLNEIPELLWQQLEPIFRLRDKIVRWVYEHLTIPAVADAVVGISIALDKLVYAILGIFLGPVMKDISKALRIQSDELLKEDQRIRLATGEESIFAESSTATDPTHSQLCKDHYDHDLNELAGRVATKITTYTIKKVIEVWQPGNIADVRPALRGILETLHHPFNYSDESEIQSIMVAEVFSYCTSKQMENPTAFAKMLERLEKSHMAAKLGEESLQIEHSHKSVMKEVYSHSDNIPTTTAHELTTVAPPRTKTGFEERVGDNIQKSIEKGKINGLSMDDLPIIRDILGSQPSGETPNPIDQALVRVPGLGLISAFEGIEMSEVRAAGGMGNILKDAVISMRLQDSEWVEKEQRLARERLGALEDRPIKEMLALLDIDAVDEVPERPTEESKTRRLMNKLKIDRKS